MLEAKEETPLLGGPDVEKDWNPIRKGINVYKLVAREFGFHFSLILASFYIGVKGFLNTMITVGQVPLYKDFMGLPSERYQALTTVAATPWATQALMGALSDALPLFGYHKRSYIFITALLGIFALLVLSVITKTTAPEIAAAMFFLVNLFISASDLLFEGKYAEQMRDKPHTGSSLVTFVWDLVMLGTLLGSCIAGPISESGDPQILFWICIPFAVQLLIPLGMGWLQEERIPARSRGLRTDKIKAHLRLFSLAVFVAAGALVLAIVGETCEPIVQIIVGLSISIVACVAAQFCLPRVLANANLYMFLSNLLYINCTGAMTYFFLATPAQFPNGPHFSNSYYFTYTAIVGALAGMVGVSTFRIFLSKRKFRTAFWVTTLIQTLACFVDIFLVKRWNRDYLGISDKWFYMLGDAMIGNVISMMNFMPAVVLTSKVCPEGVEALIYALLAGFQNFGATVSSYTGAYIIERIGIKTDPGLVPWNFDGLARLLVVAHILLPLIAIPLTFVLIPDAYMTDEIQFTEIRDDNERQTTADKLENSNLKISRFRPDGPARYFWRQIYQRGEAESHVDAEGGEKKEN